MSLKDSLTVMIVDDMSVSRGLIVQSLEEIGIWNTTTENNGHAALAKLVANPVHLVLSDMNMPMMDGLGLLKGLSKTEVNANIDYWFDRLEMSSWTNKKVEDLSKGMSQKLQFVATVLHKPKLLILDEPFSGLDPVNTKIIKDEIFALAQAGTTIIFSTHRMEQVEEVCEDIVLMNDGEIILEGNVTDVKQQFKENQFALKTETENLELPYEIVSALGGDYIIQLGEEDDSQAVLSFLLNNNHRVLGFQEILPSLNHIFISLVEKSAARKFEIA